MIEMIILSISNIICFFLGASLRQKVDTNKEIKAPKLPNIEKVKEERKLKKEEKIQREKTQKLIDNINNFPYNQQDID